MPTLILPPRYTIDTRVLWKAATEAGWEVERLASWRPPPELKHKDELAIYAEPLFVEVVADALGIALLQPPIDWVASLPAAYRKREIRFTDLGNAKAGLFPQFVKSAEDKCFVAKVYSSGDRLPPPEVLPASTPVLTAEPVAWAIEYRFFVLDGQIVASSPYLRHGELAQAEDESWPADGDETRAALTFGHSVLIDPAVCLPPAVVVDVGHIEGRGWAVVEANAACGSGIYGL